MPSHSGHKHEWTTLKQQHHVIEQLMGHSIRQQSFCRISARISNQHSENRHGDTSVRKLCSSAHSTNFVNTKDTILTSISPETDELRR
jgi:tRNA U54 and U55 pseudouridine synthase Pus10